MAEQNVEKVYEKFAWVLIFFVGFLTLVGGAPHALGFNTDLETAEGIAGMALSELKESNPMLYNLYDFYFRGGGVSDMGFGFLVLMISLTAYRKRERWAWYVLWCVPVFFLSFVPISMSIGVSGLFPYLSLFVVLSLLGLLLPFRRFFPKGDKTQ
jgi:hypothetical protein